MRKWFDLREWAFSPREFGAGVAGGILVGALIEGGVFGAGLIAAIFAVIEGLTPTVKAVLALVGVLGGVGTGGVLAIYYNAMRSEDRMGGGLLEMGEEPLQLEAPAPISPYPDYVLHRNVIWVDEGVNYYGGGPMAGGPLCPDHFGALRYIAPVEVLIGGQSESLSNKHVIAEQVGLMVCPESACKREFVFGDVGVSVGSVRGEAEGIFSGRRRQRERGITPPAFVQSQDSLPTHASTE
jgi:hypothetical protein